MPAREINLSDNNKYSHYSKNVLVEQMNIFHRQVVNLKTRNYKSCANTSKKKNLCTKLFNPLNRLLL